MKPHARRRPLRHTRQPARLRGGARRGRPPRTSTQVWCLGDLVGYGADPDACVELARANCDLCLVGNHDLAVHGDIPLTEFSRGAALAAHWTQQVISAEALEFLGRLEPQLLDRKIGLYHASPRDPIWEYVLSTLLAELCLDAQEPSRVPDRALARRAVLLATAGRAGDRRDASRAAPSSISARASGWSTRAAWASRGTATRAAPGPSSTSTAWRVSYRRTEYDVAAAAAAIRAAGLPDSLAERLQYGQ